MGMFDSYMIRWADRQEEVQTKALECLMDRFALGSTTPLWELWESRAREELSVLVEDWSLHGHFSASANPVVDRHFAFLHERGVFSDWICAHPREQAQELSREQQELWKDESKARQLRGMLTRMAAREAKAWKDLSEARQALPEAIKRRRQQTLAQRKERDIKAQGGTPDRSLLFALSFLNEANELKGRSRSELEKALDELTAHWAVISLAPEDEMRLAPPKDEAQKAVCEWLQSWMGLGDRGGFGAGMTHPNGWERLVQEARQMDPETALEQLERAARVDLFAAFMQEAAPTMGKASLERRAASALARLSRSRLLAPRAMEIMARHPNLMPESMEGAAEGMSAAEFAWVNLGLSPQRVEALMKAGSGCSAQMAYHALAAQSESLLELTLRGRHPDRVEPLATMNLLAHAAKSSNEAMLETLLSKGADPSKAIIEDMPAVDYCCRKDQETLQIFVSLDQNKLTASGRCALALMRAGARPSPGTQLSHQLSAQLAQEEKVALIEVAMSPRKEDSDKGGSIRI